MVILPINGDFHNVHILQLYIIPYEWTRDHRQMPHLLTMAKLAHITIVEWFAATSGLSNHLV
jgi:hypothetical protein